MPLCSWWKPSRVRCSEWTLQDAKLPCAPVYAPVSAFCSHHSPAGKQPRISPNSSCLGLPPSGFYLSSCACAEHVELRNEAQLGVTFGSDAEAVLAIEAEQRGLEAVIIDLLTWLHRLCEAAPIRKVACDAILQQLPPGAPPAAALAEAAGGEAAAAAGEEEEDPAVAHMRGDRGMMGGGLGSPSAMFAPATAACGVCEVCRSPHPGCQQRRSSLG